MLIENYIPYGWKNRVSRESLSILTHQNDRKNRLEMKEALIDRGVLIVSDSGGYFRPDGSKEDILKAKGYLLREQARSSSCRRACKAIAAALGPNKPEDDLIKNQMSLFDFLE